MANPVKAQSTQFIHCSFEHLPLDLELGSVLQLAQFSMAVIEHSKVSDVGSRFIDIRFSKLYINNLTVANIGLDLLYIIKPSAPKNISDAQKFDSLVSNMLLKFDEAHKKGKALDELAYGFIVSRASHTFMNNSRVADCAFSYGLMHLSASSTTLIANSRFSRILGLDQASIIFSISNSKGNITMQNSAITDTLSQKGTISLIYSNIKLINATFSGNYGK